MFPKLDGVDHVHVYVSDREQAAVWYEKVLGFTINPALAFWAEDAGGPLTVEDPSGKIHLALFQRDNLVPSTTIAFKADGQDFLQWKSHLEKENILIRCTDHRACWSLYFNDLDNNMHEITSYDYDFISTQLGGSVC